MRLLSEDKGIATYAADLHADSKFLEVSFDSATYTFLGGRFYSVQLRVSGRRNANRLVAALNDLYREVGIAPVDGKWETSWSHNDVQLRIHRADARNCVVTIQNRDVLADRRAEVRAQSVFGHP